jgi:hypothetical protein
MADDTSSAADVAADKRREARLRRVAAGLGLALRKSRTRDKDRMDYGRYRIVRIKSDYVVAGRFPYGYTLDLDAVEEILEELLEEEDRKAINRKWMAAHGRGPQTPDTADGVGGIFDAKWGG